MHPIRCSRTSLRCLLVVVACFGFDAAAEPDPTPAPVPSATKARPRHATVRPATTPDAEAAASEARGDKQHGDASYYAHHFSGRKTASGQAYDPNALTAAHRTLPLGTRINVVNPKNDRSVVVTVNDRGPIAKNRMIDVSSAAAAQLDMKKSGVTKVETQVVGRTELPKTGKADPSNGGPDPR